MTDPRSCTIMIDANALDGPEVEPDRLVDQFRALMDSGALTVVVAHGVRDEALHPHTPPDVRDAMAARPRAPRRIPSQAEHIARIRVRAILRGDARPGKHEADAAHVSEAAETGCGYFVTHDKRILRKRRDLRMALPPGLAIVTLAQLFAILDRIEGADADMDGSCPERD